MSFGSRLMLCTPGASVSNQLFRSIAYRAAKIFRYLEDWNDVNGIAPTVNNRQKRNPLLVNGLSIDLEDWFCAYNQGIHIDRWNEQEQRLVGNTQRLLALFDAHAVHATFFVLGWFVERYPELIAQIESQGHEIATHGYSHTLLTKMTPDEFEADLVKALRLTQACVSSPILGFRAPSFSVTKETMWVFDILFKHGIRYDSSIFPVGFHPDYGIDDYPLDIQRNGRVVEVPISCVHMAGRKIPCSGGGYFRIFPLTLTKALFRRCQADGRPVIFYLHPWEIDPGQPFHRLKGLKTFRHYYNLKRTFDRFDRLLDDQQFVPIKDLIGL